ncbi:MAG TPA: hypothetical protein VJ396_09235 [Acidiferrobacterales bacterium]|nr:hypothetical protein [Acidiferrobacterales bacterium]
MLLTFDFKNIEEAQEFLAGLLAKPNRPELVVAPDAVAMPAKDSESAPKKPGRPKKATAPEPAKEHTIDDCRTALSQLFDKKGREAAKSALETFNVARVGELTASVYALFIVTCAELSK